MSHNDHVRESKEAVDRQNARKRGLKIASSITDHKGASPGDMLKNCSRMTRGSAQVTIQMRGVDVSAAIRAPYLSTDGRGVKVLAKEAFLARRSCTTGERDCVMVVQLSTEMGNNKEGFGFG